MGWVLCVCKASRPLTDHCALAESCPDACCVLRKQVQRVTVLRDPLYNTFNQNTRHCTHLALATTCIATPSAASIAGSAHVRPCMQEPCKNHFTKMNLIIPYAPPTHQYSRDSVSFGLAAGDWARRLEWRKSLTIHCALRAEGPR